MVDQTTINYDMKTNGNRYSKEQKDNAVLKITEYISNGRSITAACKIIDVNRSTYLRWVSECDHYEKSHFLAMQTKADVIFEQILTIADATADDVTIDDDGRKITNHNVIQRDRLRVDARKWIAAKMNPKKYSDKYSIDHTSKDERITRIERHIITPNN